MYLIIQLTMVKFDSKGWSLLRYLSAPAGPKSVRFWSVLEQLLTPCPIPMLVGLQLPFEQSVRVPEQYHVLPVQLLNTKNGLKWAKQHNKLFFCPKAKALPQELEVGPRSGPYLLVLV